MLRHGESPPQFVDEPLLCELAVSQLRTLVVGDDPDHRAETIDHPLALVLVPESRRRRDIEDELDPGRRLVGVLTTRPTRRGERLGQLVRRDPDRVGDDDPPIVAGRVFRVTHVSQCAQPLG